MAFLYIFILLCVLISSINGYENLKRHDIEDRFFVDLNFHKSALDSELCSEQLTFIRSNDILRSRFLDAGIRTPRGILDGNFVDFGNYHQCLAIKEEDNDIQGKYCSITVPLQQDNIEWLKEPAIVPQLESIEELRQKNLIVAVCVPKPCTSQQALGSLYWNMTAGGLQFSENYCRLPNDKPFVAADYAAFVIFGLLGIFTIFSTIYDVCHTLLLKKDPKTANAVYQTFSVYKNARTLTTYKSSSSTIECLDGIRVLATMWIILGHGYSTIQLFFYLLNPDDVTKWHASRHSVLITAFSVTVDTFFLISGLLVVYSNMSKIERMALLKNIHFFYLNRLFRVFPILAAGVLLMASWFNHVTDGPYWLQVSRTVSACRNNWWLTLLHVQNYFIEGGLCLEHSWYIAVDVQLHIISPIVLFWILTNKRGAWCSLTLALVIALTTATVYNAVNNFISHSWSVGMSREYLNYQTRYYISIINRASPFFVGMVFGYLIYNSRQKTIHLSKVVVSLLWVLVIGIISSVVYIAYPITQPDWDNAAVDVMINSFMRPLWALALGCLIFACDNGYGGPINWLLSLNFWKIPSRLTYAMFIFHYPLQMLMNSAMVTPILFNDGHLLFRFIADFSLALLVGFLVTLLVDVPFSSLFRMIIGNGITKTKKTPAKKTDEFAKRIDKEAYLND